MKTLTIATILLTSLFIATPSLSYASGSDNSSSNLANDPAFVQAAKDLIRASGYVCYNVEKAYQKGWDGSIYVACDDYSRRYNIKEDVYTESWVVTTQ